MFCERLFVSLWQRHLRAYFSGINTRLSQAAGTFYVHDALASVCGFVNIMTSSSLSLVAHRLRVLSVPCVAGWQTVSQTQRHQTQPDLIHTYKETDSGDSWSKVRSVHACWVGMDDCWWRTEWRVQWNPFYLIQNSIWLFPNLEFFRVPF